MMHRLVRSYFFSCFLLAFLCAAHAHAEIEVSELTCEYAVNPLAVGTKAPCFSWVLDSRERDQKQSAYQILVAESEGALEKDRGTVWDSGRVESSLSTHLRFEGKPLNSNRTYHWKVRVWDGNGIVSPYSKTGRFSTALLAPEDWKAKWIGRGASIEPNGPAGYLDSPSGEDALENPAQRDGRSTLLRREFAVSGPVRRARVHVCGLGLYELYLNGGKVGQDVLAPAKSHYRKQVFYNTYDITEELNNGDNAFGIILGNGWFNPYKKWWSWRMQWFGSQRAILQLHIDYEDGTSEALASDDSWKASVGAVTHGCIYDGEKYDANLEQPGWAMPAFDDAAWEEVNIVESPGGELIPQTMEPIQVTEEITPVALTNPKPGVWIYDMGQNFAGWTRLSAQGSKGEVVTLRHAENIGDDGLLDTKSMGQAGATDEYTLKGEGVEVYEPRFCFYGFRYVEMTGFPGTPTVENLTGCAVHSNCKTMGTFQCGNELINRIHRCTLWSQRSNMVGYPMDCPQREERLGWMGDAHVAAEEAMHNFHMPLFYKNWLRGLQLDQDTATGDMPYISPRPFEAGQTPAWSSAYILILWYHYLHYGDARILEEHFENMKGYVDFLDAGASDYIYPRDRYGDWLSVAYSWKRGDPESATTGYFYYTASIVAKAARILGKTDDEQHYAHLAQQIKDAYNKRFLDLKTHQYDNGSQFSNAFPLFLGIVPPAERPAVLKNLIDDIVIREQGHLTTGILGSKYMMEALSQEGQTGLAYLLATQTDFPSWGNLIENRTTLSEHWNQTGSNNHVMFGSIDAWFYRVLGGINGDESNPGFGHVIIKPYFHPEIGWVKSSLNTVKGKIRSNWEIRDDSLRLEIAIPVNTTATLHILADDISQLMESGKPVQSAHGIEFLRKEGDFVVLAVGSGKYTFVSREVRDILPKRHTTRPEIFPEETFIALPNTVAVDIKCRMQKADIHYTLDGSEPTEDSARFVEPFVLGKSAQVKAIAFQKGCLPSLTRSRTFSFVDPEKNGLDYEFYEGSYLKLPDFNTIKPLRKGHVYQPGLREIETPEFDYVLRFTGQIEILEEGEYTFYTVSNDGSQLFIDNQLVVDNDNHHLSMEKSGKIHLTSGLHPLKITYFQQGGGTDLRVLYEGQDIEKMIIPGAAFFRK
jgi:alpha-L-rhamnosidase